MRSGRLVPALGGPDPEWAERRGLRLALIGVGIGAIANLALIRFTESQLYWVEPADLKTFLGSIGVLVLVALLASYAPASQATEVDPVEALRRE